MYQVKSVPVKYWVGPAIPLLVMCVMPLLVWQLSIELQTVQQQFNNRQFENTQWQRYIALLAREPASTYSLPSSRTALEVSLREAAQRLQQLPEIKIDAFNVLPGDPIEVSDELPNPLKPIRVGFEATLAHAPALLTILGSLVEEAGWRVAEVRGCAVQRLVSESRLAAACTVDIYHWSWAANTDAEDAL